MLNVKFWNLGKMEISTARPSDSAAAYTYSNVLLKDNCSLVNPALQLSIPAGTDNTRWNYCYIQEFHRYYYVVDWMYDRGIWTAELQVDVLASFKDEIGGQTLYVLRSSHTYNGDVPDSTYPCTAAQATFQSTAEDNPFGLVSGSYTQGTYIAGIVNKESDNGCVTYYAFNALGFKYFCQKLYTYSTGWLNIDITEVSENLQKALVNPFQYIVSCHYIPVPVSWFVNNNIGTATTTVYFGWWDVTLPVACRIIPYNARYSFTKSLTIPKHPQAATRGNYLNLSPYTYYTLRFYPYGTFDIDTEALSGWTTLDLYSDLDICSGKGILTLAVNGKNNPIRSVETNIAVSIPTASIQVDYMNLGSKSTGIMAAAEAVQMAGSGSGSFFQNLAEKGKQFIGNIRAGNWQAIGQGAKQTISNIASAATAGKATVELTGQQGSYSLYEAQTLTLSGRFIPIAAEDLSHRGRPLCALKQLDTIPGFILCADAEIYIPNCTDREKTAIRAYLEGGIYFQ